MTDDELKELETLAESATPGAWTASDPHPMCGEIWVVCEADPDGAVATGFDDTPRDAEFVAAARTAVPALISELRAVRAALEQATRERDDMLYWGYPRADRPLAGRQG